MERRIVIDLEMCGIPKNIQRRVGLKREIIQLGAVILEDGIVRARYSEYVMPRYGHVDCYIKDLTGIRQADVCQAEPIETVLEHFMSWAGPEEAVFVSWSMNDRAQLRREMEAKHIVIDGFDRIFETWEDCQEMYGKVMESSRCYALREAVICADIDTEGHEHDALSDAVNTALLYEKLRTEGEAGFNRYFRKAHQETQPEILQFSLGDLFGGISFGIAVTA
ncbi:MAG: exonuclease domain-containing protein [Clostridium sp.]|nr:exonuclease domain-containing protein [Clostridium sp.]